MQTEEELKAREWLEKHRAQIEKEFGCGYIEEIDEWITKAYCSGFEDGYNLIEEWDL